MEMEKPTTQATARFHNPFSVSSFTGVDGPPTPQQTFPVSYAGLKPTKVEQTDGAATGRWPQILSQFPSIFPSHITVGNPSDPNVAGLTSKIGEDDEKVDTAVPSPAFSENEPAGSATVFSASPTLAEFQKILQSFNAQQQQQQQQQQIPLTSNGTNKKLQLQWMQQMFSAAEAKSPSPNAAASKTGPVAVDEPRASRASSSQSCASSSSTTARPRKQLEVDKNGEEICPVCSQSIGTQPSQWQEHARVERLRLHQLIQQLKSENHGVDRNRSTPATVALRQHELELRRIRGNQTKRAQMKLLATDTAAQRFVQSSSGQRLTDTSLDKPEQHTMCSECQLESEYLIVSGTAVPRSPPRCFACFRRAAGDSYFRPAVVDLESVVVSEINGTGDNLLTQKTKSPDDRWPSDAKKPRLCESTQL